MRRTDLFLPWSTWARDQVLAQRPWLDPGRITVLHPGIDLSLWNQRPARHWEGPFRVLFVGGDFLRKGGDILLDAAAESGFEEFEIHIATQSSYFPRL